MLVWPAKDPDELLDYSWTVPLDDGDTISGFTILRDSGTVTIVTSGSSGAAATAWLSGGTNGETALFTLTVTTNGGRTFEEKAALAIVAKSDAARALISAFPRFAAVPASTIEFWLTRAARGVDTTWTADDREMGQMLLACHLMTLQGLGTGAEAEVAAAGAAGFKRIKSASLELERFDGGAVDASSLSTTSYGQQFASLRRQNLGGPRVMPTGTAPYDGLRYPQGDA